MADIKQLAESDVGHELAATQRSLRELTHRRLLGSVLTKVEAYILRRCWCERARESLGSTKAITNFYYELYSELVTERYASEFLSTLKRFKKSIRVTVEARGSKGETVRQIVLSPEAFPSQVPVDRVLSQGEKTAVALSDFITEATINERCDGIIPDDPVTSMDGRCKEALALSLAALAAKIQVVVFTHDLSFLYRIVAHAREQQVDILSHWIREESGKPGFIYAENSPVCERDYRSAQKAREHYSAALPMSPAQQQSALQQGFAALRTSYEALVIFELFNGVVQRFEERISFGALKDLEIDHSLVSQIIAHMEALSRHIEGHLHSDRYSAAKPTPEELFQEIEAFEEIKKKHAELKKAKQAAGKAEKLKRESTTIPEVRGPRTL